MPEPKVPLKKLPLSADWDNKSPKDQARTIMRMREHAHMEHLAEQTVTIKILATGLTFKATPAEARRWAECFDKTDVEYEMIQ